MVKEYLLAFRKGKWRPDPGLYLAEEISGSPAEDD